MYNYNLTLTILNKNFKDLKFDSVNHIYTQGILKLKPVSKELENFYKPFDTDISKYVAIKRGITQEEVLKEWEDKKNKSLEKGNIIHDFAERCINYYLGEIDYFYYHKKYISEQKQVLKYILNQLGEGLIPLKAEYRMYYKLNISTKDDLAGTLDILWYDKKTSTCILDDYKTNENLFKQYKNQKLLEPFSYIDDTPYSKYTLQLSYYKLMLNQLGLVISKNRIVHITEKQYKIYNLQQLDNIIKTYYENIRSNSESPIFVF